MPEVCGLDDRRDQRGGGCDMTNRNVLNQCADCGIKISSQSLRCRGCYTKAHIGPVARGVRSLREANPRIRARDMSVKLGVSRQRIGQILKKQGLQTDSPPVEPNRCLNCHAVISYRAKRCIPCFHAKHQVGTICAFCHSALTVQKALYRRFGGQNFCNYSHKMKWGWLPGNFMATRKSKHDKSG
jgi:hypothetical protein